MAGCRRAEKPAVGRLAVLPFENLTGDASLDWAGAAFPAVIIEQASGSTHRFPYPASDLRAARLSGALHALEGYVTRRGARLVYHAVLENLATGRMDGVFDAESALHAGVAEAADSVARALEPAARPFGTRNAAAIEFWGRAIVSVDAESKARELEQAIAADPNFGAAYTDLVEVWLARADAARWADAIQRGEQRAGQFNEFERARFQVAAAGARNDANARREALLALSRLVPADIETLRVLGQYEVAARRFPSAVELYRRALSIEPANAAVLNELGYAEVYNGNLEGARQALERYRAIQPDDPNALDSLGEAHFTAGRFAEAEKYFLEGQRMAPRFQGGVDLLKGAQARFLQGNLSGADELYSQFEKSRGGDPVAGLRRAQWLFLTGRAAQAMAAAEAASKGPNPEMNAYAFCHLALWSMDLGDRAKASGYAAQAAQARSPAIRRLAALSVAEAGGDVPGPVGDLGRAMAELYARNAAAAVPTLALLYERSQPTIDGEVRTLYAWALADSGKRAEAKLLVTRYFQPLGLQEDSLLAATLFPRFLALRKSLGVN